MKTTLAAALCVMASGALAQGFEGAEISAALRSPTDNLEFGNTIYSGGLEFGITPNIGVAAGFTSADGGTGYGLTGIYRLGSGTALGLFVGRDDLDAGAVDFAGVQAARTFSGIDAQAYLGAFDGDAGGGSLMGVRADFDFARAFTLSGSFDSVAGDSDSTRLAIGAAYRIGNGPQVFAELGTLNDDADTGAFITLGARIGLGSRSGTTFDQRGLLQSLGGF